jgi:hypothetical protein
MRHDWPTLSAEVSKALCPQEIAAAEMRALNNLTVQAQKQATPAAPPAAKRNWKAIFAS